jgi:hypothetical protein
MGMTVAKPDISNAFLDKIAKSEYRDASFGGLSALCSLKNDFEARGSNISHFPHV